MLKNTEKKVNRHIVSDLLKTQRSLMSGIAVSDTLRKFQLTNVIGIEFTEAVSVTGMNLARWLHSILIESNEYWWSLRQASLQAAAVGMQRCSRVCSRWSCLPALLAALSRGSNQASWAWCESGAGCAGAHWGLGWEMVMGLSLCLRRVSVKGWVLLWVLERGGLMSKLSV